MRSRDVAIVSALLAVATAAHYLARFTQIGGMQMAPSMAFYCLIPLLLTHLTVGECLMIGVVNGILLTIATSSPFPIANIPAHFVGFVIPKIFVEAWKRRVNTSYVPIVMSIAILCSGVTFVIVSYYGLLNVPQLAVSREAAERFAQRFSSITLFLSYSLTFIILPTLVLDAFVLGPVLYMALKPALERYGFI